MPNTKTKKFDFQIFLAVSMILLVICCAVVCIVVGNNDNCVAYAYTNDEVGVSNLEFRVTDSFYIKNFNNVTNTDVLNLINYFTYFIPDILDSQVSLYKEYEVGIIDMYYRKPDGASNHYYSHLKLSIDQMADTGLIQFSLYISEYDDLFFFNLSYNYIQSTLDNFSVNIHYTQSVDSPNNYNVNIMGSPSTVDTFANQFVYATLGDTSLVTEIRWLDFNFFNFVNIGCFVSPNETFANPPVVMPESVYNNEINTYENQIASLNKQITSYQNEVERKNIMISNLSEANQLLRDQITTLQQEKTDLQNQVASLNSQITTLQEEKTALQTQITTLQEEKIALQNQNTDLQNQVSSLNSQITTLQEEKTALQNQITSLQQEKTDLQNQVASLNSQITTLQNQNTELQNQITDLQNQVNELQNQNSQLQTQLNEYQSYYDSIAWFDVLSSNLNNISTINIGGYKSNLIDVKANDGTGKNQVNVWNNESDTNTAFAIVMPRFFGNGTRFRFSYNGLIGSASGMANQPASLGYINSTGNLISLMELPTASSSYVEFNISEEVNTFVVYTSGNLIMFYDFRFQVFSLDVDSIYDTAYENGVKHGYNTGYYAGKNEGIAQASDYSFLSLFSAVFDAPITAIVGRWGDSDGDGVYEREGGMLNFYIPGLEINFAPFLLSMFTIAIIVMIIRFILARKS